MSGGWLARARNLLVREVAERLGLRLVRRTIAPCPGCGAEQRSTSHGDKRGPIGCTANGLAWRCHRCAAAGDALDLVSYALAGQRLRELRDTSAVRAWLEEGGHVAAEPRPAPIPEPPAYPPQAEALELWHRCTGVTEDEEVSAWLRSRGLDPATCEDFNLCRALPASMLKTNAAPRWAHFRGQPWRLGVYRCVFPLYDAHGRLRSVRARAVQPVSDAPKSVAPVGLEVRGLVLADDGARRMLAEAIRPPALIVAEGEPDHATWATAQSDANEDAAGVLGIVSGSWTPELAARVPDGTTVVIANHDDSAGRTFARGIAESLAGRCFVRVFSGENE